jgi:hypothetical protein
MDFKNYYHNKLNEEGVTMDGLDADAPKPQSQQTQQNAAPQGKSGIVTSYVSGTSMKLGLRKLGDEVGDGIFEYATKQLVQPTDFKSEDDYIKYCQDIRTGVAEKYNKTLSDLLSQIGLFIDNKVHNACPNK